MMALYTEFVSKSHWDTIVMYDIPIVSFMTIISKSPDAIRIIHCTRPNPLTNSYFIA